ncbi:MAG: hypothetical protein JNL32_04835 [Candidatus Kapabacteria bacterium]|nr:hypothetical protein [Candidatus Kapabacteria bacterium]
MNNIAELISKLSSEGYVIERVEANHEFLKKFIADENYQVQPFNAMLSTTIHKVSSELFDARFWYTNKDNAMIVSIKDNVIQTMTISKSDMFKLTLDERVPYTIN